ncbi:MAG TPA: rhomboid family intramembrane serine protease [Actinomycetota bacterium]|nr:rhomboid family intramembrane serine protease [Actinomycetota bacterium]
MDDTQSGSTQVAESEETFCYAHPKTATKLRCSRCDRPICGRCAIPASVGQHCPECVAEARRTTRRVKSVARATAPVVLGLIAINVVVFLGQMTMPDLTNRFAAFVAAIDGGEWWRLLTAMFLHGGVIHIAFNMYVLYGYGPHVEQTFGSVRFLILYLICGFGGSALSYAFNDCLSRSVGASGALFGVVGLLLVYFYKRSGSRFNAEAMRTLLIFVALNLVLGFVVPRIDNLAHIGGLLTGVALGVGFDRGGSMKRSAALIQFVTAVVVAGVALALVLYRTANLDCSFLFQFG